MTDEAPSNQRIRLDADVLAAQVATLEQTAATLSQAAQTAGGTLNGNAFGVLSAGILVPSVNDLAGRARELLDAAQTLSARVGAGVASAAADFEAIEDDAVRTFTSMEDAG